ncbi:MAG: PolyA polymerase protein, partial [candidate division WS6 bacterium GW2011_GWF1_36_8]
MKVKIQIPEYVQKVSRMLSKEGFECYLVGGAVRDVVMGLDPHDYDLATDALPDEMLNIFP